MRPHFPTVLACTMALAGCGISPEQATTGNYLADPSRVILPDLAAFGVDKGDKRIKQVKSALSSATLKLRPNKTFVLVGIPGKGQEGKWSLDGDQVTLVPKDAPKGEGIPEKIVLTRNPKTNELTLSENFGIGDVKIVLIKNGS